MPRTASSRTEVVLTKTRSFTLLLLALAVSACGTKAPSPEQAAVGDHWQSLGLTKTEKDFDRRTAGIDAVPIDHVPTPGRDYHPRFPARLEYDPASWTTHTPSPSVANPDAPKGGTLRLAIQTWPPTLRTEGPNALTLFLAQLHGLVYEPLLNVDMTKHEYVPDLADSWKILPDRKTFVFHIDPEARWADGRPVTADDVKATLEHLQNPDRQDPYSQMWRERFEGAKVLDEYTVEVRAKKPLWENFLMIATQLIYPAAYIRMDGNTYLHDWNWKLPPGSGPYELDPKDVHQERSIAVHRRKDWWARNKPWNRGTYNFDTIHWTVIRDSEIMVQKFLKGEFDMFQVTSAQRWAQFLPETKDVKRGWVQMRKIYNENPQGFSGYAFNMRSPPFDDRRVRLAFCYLFDRKTLFNKFFFNQYEYVDSYFPGQPWSRPGHQPLHYDPAKAVALLKEAGWTHRDSQNYLVNDKGERFPTLELDNTSGPSMARLFEVYRHDLWDQAGIKLDITPISWASLLKKVGTYQFQLAFFNWTGSAFPNPESMWASKYADQPQSNNINGFKDPEVDKLIDAYKYEFDQNKRIEMLQRIDAILYKAHPYALAWYAPFFRIAYWDKFGHPPEYASRYGDDVANVYTFWWHDASRDTETRQNMHRDLPSYPGRASHQADSTEIKYWLNHEHPMKREH